MSTSRLLQSGIPTPVLDVEILLADLLAKDRSWIHAHRDYELSQEQISILDAQIKHRSKHKPIAYIRGKQEFFGREFKVSPDTLTPRPETETMVEMALELISKQKLTSVADIGTGSGCIIISLALESKTNSVFTGYDISNPALEIAKTNAKRLKSNAKFVEANINESTEQEWQQAEMIVANLPYVPEEFNINLAASHEPKLAIFGGIDGLDYYRTMFKKLKSTVKYVLTESLPPQHKNLTDVAKNAGFKLKQTQDFIQIFTRA